MKRKFLLIISTFLLLSLICKSQIVQKDSVQVNHNLFKSKTFRISVVPIGLFAATAATWNSRESIRDVRNRYLPVFKNRYDDYLQYAPTVAVFALNAAGVKGKHKTGRMLVSYAFSATIMAALVNGIKHTTKIERPDISAKNSFPSGHTANAFMNATFLHKEYGQFRSPLYSIAGYTAASATALGRGLNNRHWITDVLAGAGIGILSTELGYIVADEIFRDRGLNIKMKNNPLPVRLNPSFLEFKLGYVIATSNDLIKSKSDIYANTGFNTGVEGAWFINPNLGFGGEFSFSSFPMKSNVSSLDDPDIDEIMDGLEVQPLGIKYLHLGPYFSLPLSNNWFLTAKANAGISEGATGKISLKIKEAYQGDFGMKTLPSIRYKPTMAFSYSFGIGIQKLIQPNIALKVYANYVHSRNDLRLDFLDDIDTNGNYTYITEGYERIGFNNINFGLGLTAFLWK